MSSVEYDVELVDTLEDLGLVELGEFGGWRRCFRLRRRNALDERRWRGAYAVCELAFVEGDPRETASFASCRSLVDAVVPLKTCQNAMEMSIRSADGRVTRDDVPSERRAQLSSPRHY